MKTLQLSLALVALCGFSAKALAHNHILVGGPAPITEACLIDAQSGWIAGLLSIAEAHRNGEDARAVAKSVIANGYNYDFAPVLFKPTLTFGEQTFRPTAEGALAYFVGGNPDFPTDEGFALKGWTAVNPQNAVFFIEGNLGLTMGHFTFVNESGDEVTVEKTFGFRRGDCGAMRIVLHKSTIPFNPAA